MGTMDFQKDKTDRYFMQEALKQARKAYDQEEVPVGAVIVYKNKIIARAHNQIKLLKDPTAHAEMIAITQAANYLENERLLETTMYVTIEPCAMCAGALVLARVKQLFFGAHDHKTGACGSVLNVVANKDLNHCLEVNSGLLGQGCAALMVDFMRERRNPVLN